MSKMLVCFTEHSTSELMMQSRHSQSNSLCGGNSAICSSRFGRLLKKKFLEQKNGKKQLKAKENEREREQERGGWKSVFFQPECLGERKLEMGDSSGKCCVIEKKAKEPFLWRLLCLNYFSGACGNQIFSA